MTLVTDTSTLAEFCKRAASAPYVTVDTEFMREKTYWPLLCLVQVGRPDEAIAVDALADGVDLAPLFELMANPDVLKVFHAARQDMEIFFHLMGALPAPVFDTQVAAMVCGFGDSVGYETLVNRLAKARIDKSSRFTDWAARPLSKKQLRYALDDVIHLRKVYEKLHRKLEDNGRESWLDEEMAVLTATRTYDIVPAESYRRIKLRGAKPRMLAILRELAAWREEEAQRLDLPRNRILRDEALLEIAHHPPDNPTALARIRGLSQRMADGRQGKAILEAVARGRDVPDADCPVPPPRPEPQRGTGAGADLLKVLLKMKCNESGVAQKLVASSADIEAIAADGENADVPALHGWRRTMFGDDALRVLRGDVAVALKNGKLSLQDARPENG